MYFSQPSSPRYMAENYKYFIYSHLFVTIIFHYTFQPRRSVDKKVQQISLYFFCGCAIDCLRHNHSTWMVIPLTVIGITIQLGWLWMSLYFLAKAVCGQKVFQISLYFFFGYAVDCLRHNHSILDGYAVDCLLHNHSTWMVMDVTILFSHGGLCLKSISNVTIFFLWLCR